VLPRPSFRGRRRTRRADPLRAFTRSSESTSSARHVVADFARNEAVALLAVEPLQRFLLPYQTPTSSDQSDACLSARTDSVFWSRRPYDHEDRRASSAPDGTSPVACCRRVCGSAVSSDSPLHVLSRHRSTLGVKSGYEFSDGYARELALAGAGDSLWRSVLAACARKPAVRQALDKTRVSGCPDGGRSRTWRTSGCR
jgi:hypothetical protein